MTDYETIAKAINTVYVETGDLIDQDHDLDNVLTNLVAMLAATFRESDKEFVPIDFIKTCFTS